MLVVKKEDRGANWENRGTIRVVLLALLLVLHMLVDGLPAGCENVTVSGWMWFFRLRRADGCWGIRNRMQARLISECGLCGTELGDGIRMCVQQGLDLGKVSGPFALCRKALQTTDDLLVEALHCPVALRPVCRDGAPLDAASGHPVRELVADEGGCVVGLDGGGVAKERSPVFQELDDSCGVGLGGCGEKAEASTEIDGGENETLGAVGLHRSNDVQSNTLVHVLPGVERGGNGWVMSGEVLALWTAAYPLLYMGGGLWKVYHALKLLCGSLGAVVTTVFMRQGEPARDFLRIEATRYPEKSVGRVLETVMTEAKKFGAVLEASALLRRHIVRAASGAQIVFHLEVPAGPSKRLGIFASGGSHYWGLRERLAPPLAATEKIGDDVRHAIYMFYSTRGQVERVQVSLDEETLVFASTCLLHNSGIGEDGEVFTKDVVSHFLKRPFEAE